MPRKPNRNERFLLRAANIANNRKYKEKTRTKKLMDIIAEMYTILERK